MKQKIFEVGKKAYTFNQARYEEDMGRCVITAVSERYQDVQMSCKIFKNLTCVFISTYTI